MDVLINSGTDDWLKRITNGVPKYIGAAIGCRVFTSRLLPEGFVIVKSGSSIVVLQGMDSHDPLRNAVGGQT